MSTVRMLAILVLLGGALVAADQTWNGGDATDSNWTSNQNWGNNTEPNGSGDGATMAGVTRLAPNLDTAVTLNRLTFAAGAGNFNIGGGNALTFAGTTPLIEVLAGSQTISCDVVLAVDLTVFVATGASLTISDTGLAGTGRITKVGPGTLSVSDAAVPAAPVFSSPASDGAPTTSPTPTWTWSNTGFGVFRYRFDGGGWADITATSFTPLVALGTGLHTVEVQAYSRLGALSPAASRGWNVSIDDTPPHIVSRTTVDDGNGHIDAVDILFSEDMGTVEVGTWTVGTWTVGTPAWQGDNRTLRLPLTEQPGYDTGALPDVQYTLGAIADAHGVAFPVEGAATAAVDGAAPVVVGAKGVFGGSNLALTFSEPVVTTAAGAGNLVDTDLAFSPANTVTTFTDANGLDQSVSVTLGTAIAAGNQAGVLANQVYDLAGNPAAAATIAITEPVAARETQAAGPWTDPNTWVGLVVPGYSDDVILRHAVTYAVYDFRSVRSLTIESGGSLTATADVASNSSYTILEVADRKITANANATVSNVQFYDSYIDVDTIITVAPGVTLTLSNGTQGHFLRRVVKRGSGLLVWNSPANGLSGGPYDDGPTRIEAGTFQLQVANGRPANYEWAVLGGTTLDLRVDQSISLLTGQGTVTRGAVGTTTLALGGSSWSGSIQNGSGTLAVDANGVNVWSGNNTFTGGVTVSGGNLTISGTRAIADTCNVALSAGTLTVDSAETIARLSGAGSVALNANLVLNHGTSTDTLSGVVSGAGGLSIAGSSGGSLALTGANTFSGGTTLAAGGTAVIGSNTGLGASSGALAFAGGTLKLSGHVNMTAAALADNTDGSGPTGLFPFATQGTPADRPISVGAADGAIDMGAFSLALPAFDTLVGQDLSVRGTAASTNYNGTDSALFLVVPPATTRSMAGKVLSGSGRFGFLVKRGTGTLSCTSTGNTFDKNIVRVEEGVLDFGASGSLGSVSANGWVYILPGATASINNIAYAAAPILYLSGTLSVSGTSSWDGQVNLWSSSPTIAVGAAAQLTLPQVVVTSSASALTKSGAGRLVLGNSGNTFTLPVSVNGGTLEAAANGCLGNVANGLTLAGGRLYAPAGFTSARTLALGAGGGVVEVAESQTLTWNGAISGTTGLSKDGKGVLVLGNAGNTFTGGTTVSQGGISIAADGALGGAGSGVTLAGGSLASTATLTVAAARTIALGAGGGIIDVASGTTLSYAGSLTGATGLGKIGAGTLALGGDSSAYTGQIGVSGGGTLRATHASALGASSANTVIQDGSAVEFSGGITVNEPLSVAGTGPGALGALLASSGAPVLGGAITLVQTANPTLISVTGTSLTLNGVVSGAGGLAKVGTGTLVLGNAGNTFSGNAGVTVGTLSIGADGNLGNVANQLLIDGGTLAVTASVSSTRIVRLGSADGTITVSAAQTFTLAGFDTAAGQDLTLAGTGELRIGSAAGTSTIAGLIAGGGPLRKVNASTLVLTGASTGYTGTATVAGGTLAVAGQLAGSLVVATGGTLAGTGQVGALTVQSGGTVSPAGASAAGVLGSASATIDMGAVLDWDLGSANDQLVVAGAVSIASPITTARHLDIRAYPAPAAFGVGDYPLISAGSLTYAAGAVVMRTVPATATANYRVVADGTTLVLQRNRAPTVATGVADVSGTGSVDTTTTPPPYDIGPPGSIANFTDDVAGTAVIPLVKATDPEGALASDLVFTLKLDPSVGVIERDAGGGSWQQVTTGGALKTWTQADVAANRIRYRSTGLIGGSDAILYDVQDAQGEVSPLYLMRFTIQGNGPPVIGATPPSMTWVEEAVKPGAWMAVAPVATVQDADTPILDGGLLQVAVLNAESGDQLSFVGNGVTVANGTVAVSGVAIGSLVDTITDLAVTLNGNANEARVTALLRSASFRTSNPAPQAVLRSIRITAKDGSVGGGSTIVAYPLDIDLLNDAPSLQLQLDLAGTPTNATAVAAVPGLARLGRVVPSDPEGVPPGSIAMVVTQSPLRGTMNYFLADGTFSYTPTHLAASLTDDVLQDSFTVTVTDLPFDGTPRRVVGSGNPLRYQAASRQVVVPIRIATAGAGLAFVNPARMTVDPLSVGSFSYTPQMRLPPGAGTLAFELVSVPGGVTLGTGPGQINFNPVTGAIEWPAVPTPPVPAVPYWRFGLLATDPNTGSAVLLPIMLRVGPGGING